MDDAYWTMYSIVIQIGAILALMLLFLDRIVEFLRNFPEGDDGRHTWVNHHVSCVRVYIRTVIATA